MTRYILSTDDDGPNVLFSGTKAELAAFIRDRFMLDAEHRSLPFSSRAAKNVGPASSSAVSDEA